MNQRAPQVSGYSEAGASLERRALRGFVPNSGSPAEDIDRNLSTLRQRSRMLVMSTPVATAAITTNRTKVIGTGLTLKAAVDRERLGLTPEAAKEWERRAEAEFRLWCRRENCDALGLNSFAGLQQLALYSQLSSGDCFVLLRHDAPTPMTPYGLRLQLVEADRVSTPSRYCGGLADGLSGGAIPEGEPGAGHKIYDGVEVDAAGRVVAYHVADAYPRAFLVDKAVTWTRVLAWGERSGLPNVLHLMAAERPDQYRGVPYLAPVIEPLLQMRRYTESELMAALVQSYFTAWITTDTNGSEIPINEVGAGDIDGAGSGEGDEGISHHENEYELGSGTVLHLRPGESVSFANPNIPTSGYEPFIKTNTRLVGSALELPYDVIAKEFNSSYSASRGALLEAWEGFKMRRAWFVEDFCQPVYELWLAEAVARGRIKAPGFFDDPALRAAWCGARWIGPVQGQLDPKKEVEANILMVQYGFKTREQVTREMGGGDWGENAEQLRQENEQLPAPAGTGAFPEDGDDDKEEEGEDT